MFCSKEINTLPNIQKKVQARETPHKIAIKFLKRDDNSRMMLGKNDRKKAENRHTQKQVCIRNI